MRLEETRAIYGQKIHFCLTAIFGSMLLPACVLTRLRIVPSQSTSNFLFAWAFQAILWAALLYQIGVRDSWSPFRSNIKRLFPVLLMTIMMIVVFGVKIGTEIAVAGFAIVEFHFRRGSWRRVGSALLPWLYLAIGILIALYFSSVIVTLRPCTAYDTVFSRLDSFLMFGESVPGLSGAVPFLYVIAEPVYYSMGGVMGSAILFLCLAGDQQSAFSMAGAILTAYYLSLIIFAFLPAQGPFIAAGMPPQLFTANVQKLSFANATLLYHHAGWVDPPLAYYVAFPSLHVAQPLIAAWFLRRWRGVSVLVLFYCAMLIAAIVILQWHYVVDILGGLGVAILAVSIVSLRQRPLFGQNGAHGGPCL